MVWVDEFRNYLISDAKDQSRQRYGLLPEPEISIIGATVQISHQEPSLRPFRDKVEGGKLSTDDARVIPRKARRRLPSFTLYQLRSGRILGIATTSISHFYLSGFLI